MNSNRKKNIFIWSSHIVGLIPGLFVLRNSIPVPSTFSCKVMGAIVESICGFILIYIWFNKDTLKSLPNKYYNKRSIMFFFLFILSFFFYQQLFGAVNIDKGTHLSGALNPLWLSNEAKKYIMSKEANNIREYFEVWGPKNTMDVMSNKSPLSLFITRVAVYLSFFSIFIFLTISFVLLWIKYQSD